MKQLTVKRLPAGDYEAEQIPQILDAAAIPFEKISCADWAEEYPYTPLAEFRLAHTDDSLLINYRVEEDSVAAVAPADNGRVWEDSCCEFFSMPADDGLYYNIECNCAGTLLVGSGAEREGRVLAPQDVLRQVRRWSSLGRKPFSEREGKVRWQMALVIPISTFFRSHVKPLGGRSFRANFYKCGDRLSRPHFLSWNPISIPKPDFHRPDYFGQLSFE